MEKKLEIKPPTMPEFILFKTNFAPRQNGFNPPQGLPIETLTKEEAEEFAELMKTTFIKHWEDTCAKLNLRG